MKTIGTEHATSRTARWTALICGLAIFMASLDNLIVTTALPSIRLGLHTDIEGLQWVTNAYTLTYAVLLLTGAAIADRYGRKRLFLIGLTVFTGSSAWAALAPGVGALIAARTVQGVGAAIVTPLTLTLIAAAVPPQRRGAVLGAWGAISGLGIALGPVIGGAIVEHSSWTWIFWINVPIGLVLLVMAGPLLRESRRPTVSLDLLGTLLATAGLFGVVFALVRGNDVGWTSGEVLGPLSGGTVLVAGFVGWEFRAQAPILPMSLFGNRGFSATNTVALAMGFGMFGSVFLLAQFLQTVQKYTPLEAGLLTLPWTGMPLIVSPIAGIVSNRVGGRRLLIAGMVFQAVGLGWITAVLDPAVAYSALVVPFALSGIGMGLFFAPIARLALGFVPRELEGVASGASNALRQLGTVLGVSVLGAVFSAKGGFSSGRQFVDGLVPAMWVGTVVLGFAVLIAISIPRLRVVL